MQQVACGCSLQSWLLCGAAPAGPCWECVSNSCLYNHPAQPPTHLPHRLHRLITTIGAERGLDTLVWQLIASVAAPGYTIHCVVAAANWALAQAEQSAEVAGGLQAAAGTLGLSSEVFLEAFNKSMPTALGLIGTFMGWGGVGGAQAWLPGLVSWRLVALGGCCILPTLTLSQSPS